MSSKILPSHLERRAVVYMRQSTLKQVYEHRESTTRQYGLKERAKAFGWPQERIEVIDEDLGQSGSGSDWRSGFKKIAEGVAHGRIGAVFALEMSRLARSSADWHKLVELCALADVVIVDEQTVYAPRDYDDRLLLGLKGTMSEAELYWMRLRLEGGKMSKARRGELRLRAPAGYEWDSVSARFILSPDESVQRAIRLIFKRFRIGGSAYSVTRYLVRNGLQIPVYKLSGDEIHWVAPKSAQICQILHNPIYAGAYVYGRTEARLGLCNGELRRRIHRRLPLSEWKVCLRDRHPAYITWEDYMANRKKLDDNRTSRPDSRARGAAREGSALLQGLILCGRCGRRMATAYQGPNRRGKYSCMHERDLEQICFNVAARNIDEGVVNLFLDALNLPELELALAVAHETKRQVSEVEKQWSLRLECAQYEARLAERRYKAVDPDNRIVARTLEREWEEKLRAIDELEREQEEVRLREKLEITENDRARILALAQNLPAVWNADSTTNAERKNLLRMLILEITLTPVDVPSRQTRVQVLWQTGALSEFFVPRPTGNAARKTSPEAESLICKLFAVGDADPAIVEKLNQAQMLTGAGEQWSIPAVRRVRHALGLIRSWRSRRPPDRRDDGLYSVHGVAAEFAVTPHEVRRWVKRGWLKPKIGGGTGQVRWFELDNTTRQRLANHAKLQQPSKHTEDPLEVPHDE